MAFSDNRTEVLDTSTLEEDVMPSLALFGQDVQSEQTELVYTQAPIALGTALLVALLIMAGLWGVADHLQLMIWFGAQLAQTVVRSVLVYRYRHSDTENRKNSRWAQLYLAGTLVSGIIWGCAGLFIDFTWPVEYQVLLLMGLAGVIAGAISSYAALMPVYIAFLVPAIIISSEPLLMQAGQTSNAMGLLLIIFAGALLVIARNYNRSVLQSLYLRHENRELVQEMSRANVSLAKEVRERQQAENELVRDRRLFTKGPVTVFRWRAEAGWPIEYVSKTVSQFGFDGGELIQRQALFSSLVHKNDLQRVEQAKAGETDGRFMSHGIDYRMVRADGDVRWVYDYTIPVRDGHGEITHYAGYLLDITDRKQVEFELQQEKERAQVTLHSIGDAVITTDINGQVEYLNPAAEQLTGWENSIARGLPFRRVFSLFDEGSRAGIEEPVSQSLQTGSAIRSTHDCVLRRHDGRKLSIQYSISPIMSHGDAPLGIVLVFHDVTENRSMARQLDYQSTHDPLTGLINRAEFESRLKYALESAREENDQHVLCYLDLDQFKIINDTCCHTAGDTLLKEMAGLLKGCLRDSDLLGRLGGDEFGLLLKNCTLDGANEIAGNILSL
ncbi:MAG: diguanylate cyclase, partial [Pseudomonadota bacterium]|nr:diguanylate cyclase [Pseudomonadota bacterium]